MWDVGCGCLVKKSTRQPTTDNLQPTSYILQPMIHIYTGDGKGKTTAAVGLALRAAGAGKQVYICQFMKDGSSGECSILRRLKNIHIESSGRGCFVRGRPAGEDLADAGRMLEQAKRLIRQRRYELYILDEIIIALRCKLISREEVMALMECVPRGSEVVLTGRGAPRALVDRADLVTEMKERKHYFQRGLRARRGIEY